MFSILFVAALVIPIGPADLVQPATYPFLSYMWINAVMVGNNLAALRWPIMIHNPEGITVKDVFQSLHSSLHQPVYPPEFRRWNWMHREMAEHAVDLRRANPNADPDNDLHLRRGDYFGPHNMFRGLAPSHTNDGWVLFIGAE